MNKIDNFYKKKESLENFKDGLKNYNFYTINVVIGEDFVRLHLHLTDTLNVDKEYLKEIYYKLERLLEDESLRNDLQSKVIKELETELEKLKNEIKKDFDLGEVK